MARGTSYPLSGLALLETIYAEDIDGEYLQRLERRLRRERMSHVHIIRGELRDSKLPRAAVDVAILAHMYHEIENHYELLYRLWGSLAAGARVAVVDVDKRTENHGTPPALLRCEMAAMGSRQVDFAQLAPADGYLAVFVPPEALPPLRRSSPAGSETEPIRAGLTILGGSGSVGCRATTMTTRLEKAARVWAVETTHRWKRFSRSDTRDRLGKAHPRSLANASPPMTIIQPGQPHSARFAR
jgi:Methyltransferase domain